jgi:hypothetical protein
VQAHLVELHAQGPPGDTQEESGTLLVPAGVCEGARVDRPPGGPPGTGRGSLGQAAGGRKRLDRGDRLGASSGRRIRRVLAPWTTGAPDSCEGRRNRPTPPSSSTSPKCACSRSITPRQRASSATLSRPNPNWPRPCRRARATMRLAPPRWRVAVKVRTRVVGRQGTRLLATLPASAPRTPSPAYQMRNASNGRGSGPTWTRCSGA